jgi:tetratricopeptide (TPR) repeat protein
MNWRRFSLPVRIVVAVVVGFYMLRFLFAGSTDPVDPATKLIGVMLAVLYGLFLFLLFGLSILRRVAGRVASLYEPDDKHFQLMPEYGVAEARVKAGRYAEAVEEFRKIIEQFPDDVFAHTRIAVLALEHLQDVALAELELNSAFAKAASADAKAMTGHRLADFYQGTLHDRLRAVEVMRRLAEKLPGSPEAVRALERVAFLEQGAEPVTSPTKVAFRETDEATLRKRRGY